MRDEGRRGLPERQTTTEEVAAALRSEILAGEYSPGERVRQDEVAARLEVSITPVREAFTLLRAEGLLRSDAHRGVQVFEPTEADLRELYEIRIGLERMAIRHAAAQCDERTLDALDEMVAKMDLTPDHDAYFALNKEFHTTLYRTAGMPRLSQMVHTLRDASDVYLHLFVVELGDEQMWEIRRASDQDHRAIMAACRERDGGTAEEVLEAHLLRTLAAVTKLLRSRQARTTGGKTAT